MSDADIKSLIDYSMISDIPKPDKFNEISTETFQLYRLYYDIMMFIQIYRNKYPNRTYVTHYIYPDTEDDLLNHVKSMITFAGYYVQSDRHESCIDLTITW